MALDSPKSEAPQFDPSQAGILNPSFSEGDQRIPGVLESGSRARLWTEGMLLVGKHIELDFRGDECVVTVLHGDADLNQNQVQRDQGRLGRQQGFLQLGSLVHASGDTSRVTVQAEDVADILVHASYSAAGSEMPAAVFLKIPGESARVFMRTY